MHFLHWTKFKGIFQLYPQKSSGLCCTPMQAKRQWPWVCYTILCYQFCFLKRHFSATEKQHWQNFVPPFGCQVNTTRDGNMKFLGQNTHKSKQLTRTQPPHLVLGHRKELWYQTHMAWTSLSPAQTAQYDNHGLLCILNMYFPVLLFQPTYCKSEKEQNKIWNLFHWVALHVECWISLSACV